LPYPLDNHMDNKDDIPLNIVLIYFVALDMLEYAIDKEEEQLRREIGVV